MNASPLDRRARRGRWLPAVRALAAVLFAGAFHSAAVTAPARVEPFDGGTWRALQAEPATASVVVFSTTDCAHCPAVLERLSQEIARGRLKARLIGVVMDRSPGEDDAALLAGRHYRRAQRLFAFDGPAQALRYGVDPRWRGVTPFVAYLAPGRPPRTVVGPPSDEDIAAWTGR